MLSNTRSESSSATPPPPLPRMMKYSTAQYSTVQYSTVPAQDDEVLHAGQLQLGGGVGGGQTHAERQGARLPAASHQEVLNINNH